MEDEPTFLECLIEDLAALVLCTIITGAIIFIEGLIALH